MTEQFEVAGLKSDYLEHFDEMLTNLASKTEKIELIDLVMSKTKWLRKRYNHLVDTDSYLYEEKEKLFGEKTDNSKRIVTIYTT